MNRKTLLVIVATFILTAASNWLVRHSDRQPAVEAEAEALPIPDYFMRHFKAELHGDNGRLSHRLEADYLAHFAEDGHSLLEYPRIVILDNRGQPKWRLSAKRGTIERGSQQIDLAGDVMLVREQASPVRLTTESLRLQPEQQFAETRSRLTVTDGQSTLTAKGMKMYMDKGRLILLADVKGRYVP